MQCNSSQNNGLGASTLRWKGAQALREGGDADMLESTRYVQVGNVRPKLEKFAQPASLGKVTGKSHCLYRSSVDMEKEEVTTGVEPRICTIVTLGTRVKVPAEHAEVRCLPTRTSLSTCAVSGGG